MHLIRKFIKRAFHIERVDHDLDEFIQDLVTHEEVVTSDRRDRLDPETILMLCQEHGIDVDDFDAHDLSDLTNP